MLTPELVETFQYHDVHANGDVPLPSWKPEMSTQYREATLMSC